MKMLGLEPFASRALPGQRRVLMYPSHSAEFIPGLSVPEGLDLVRDINLSGGVPPTVVLHPLDFTRESIRLAYCKAGARVIRHGSHRYDPFFLVRQLFELQSADEVWCFGLGTAAFHAAALDLPVRFFSAEAERLSVERHVPEDQWLADRPDITSRIVQSSSFAAFAYTELGADELLSPVALGETLGLANRRRFWAQGLYGAGRTQAAIRTHLLFDRTAGA